MARSRLRFYLLVFAGLLPLSGCAAADKSGFLPGYEKLHRGRYIENYRSSAALNREMLPGIYVDAVKGMIPDQPGFTMVEACGWLKNSALSHIRNAPGWHAVERPEESKCKLVMAITYCTPGSAGGRMFAGEFGLGHAYVQVEGRIIDSAANRDLVSFTDRRRDSGFIGIEDIGGNAGPMLVRRMLDNIARDLVKEISEDLEDRA